MRIAQIAPLTDSVPPQRGGGTERAVSFLTEELVALGHEVTLFASGDSVTRAALVPVCPQATRLDPTCREPAARLWFMLEQVARRVGAFDVIHFHTDWLHLPLFSRLGTPFVTTTHGRLDGPESRALLREFGWAPFVSVSDAQRDAVPAANWRGTVHHGLPPGWLTPPSEPTGDYVAFLGRFSPQQQADVAIRIALAAGRRIRVAATLDPADNDYVQAKIRPLLGSPGVEFVGEIREAEKAAFLGNAEALLFPVVSPEPFGMVMIEAAACGTPVIAFGCGAVPEIIEHGVSGSIVRDAAEAAAALDTIGALSRAGVRRVFESRFTSRHMANRYTDVYASLAKVVSGAFTAMPGLTCAAQYPLPRRSEAVL